MERRTFLKGAAIAAATPAVAFAPALVASLGALVAQHTDMEELFALADQREGELAKDPNKPPYPHILAGEFAPYRSGIWRRDTAFCSEADIVALFDRERNYADLYQEHWTQEKRAEVVAEADERQARALELFRLRKAVYDHWRETSGYGAAAAETHRLGHVVNTLENDILAYRPQTLDDVQTKARFFDRLYGAEPPEEFVQAFVKSLIA